jgi:sugar lactone lactonase YvrE
MVFRKAIIQVFSGNEPFGFHEFVKGTLRLFNYAVDHDIDVKVNVSGAEFEQYVIVNNYVYDMERIKPNVYYMEVDQENLIKDLDEFMKSSEPIFVVSSNVWLDRNDIYNLSYVGFDKIVRYRDYLYEEAEEKVRANLLYRPNSDNLLYGYSIIYIQRNDIHFKLTTRMIASIATQIRTCLDMNRDFMVFSSSIQFRKILSEYIEMNSGAVKTIDDSDMDIAPSDATPSVHEMIVDFIILLKSKKIYRFSDKFMQTGHNISFIKAYQLKKENRLTEPGVNVYDTALDINNIIGNLEMTLVPLYYQTYTLATQFNNPSGITMDSSGTIYVADTLNHRIFKLDSSGNKVVYAGTGVAGYVNGISTVCQFNNPTAIAADMAGNIYVADTGNNCVRIIERNYIYDASKNIVAVNGIIGTLVGTAPTLTSSNIGSGVKLNAPRGVAVDASGCVYISDSGNHRICKVTSGGTFITLAGCTTLHSPLAYMPGFNNGKGEEASFRFPSGLTVDLRGNIFVADTGNNVIRRITPSGKVSTVAGGGQPFFREGRRDGAYFNQPIGITVDSHNVLYVTDTGNNMIRRITHEGDVIPVVGSPTQATGSIDGYGAIDPNRAPVPFQKRATFYGPSAITVDQYRNLYVADTTNNSVRKIAPTFSTATKIKPVAMQTLRITHTPGVALTLGPSLSESHLTNPVILGHQRGRGGR